MLPEPLSSASILSWEKDLVIEKADARLPGVSIVIPIYNAGAFLEKTIRSLLCNDLTDVELILMDGGSTDNTAAIIAHYRQAFTVAVSEKDRGQSDAINKGFARATKPILYWLNGDDIILPNAILAMRRAFRDNPGTEVVVGNAYMTEKDFTPIHHFVFSAEKLCFDYLLDYASHHLVQPSVFFSRNAWDEVGPVKEDLHYAMDADLFLGMAAKFKFLHIPVDIGYSVYHEDCKTRGKRGESISELAFVQATHGGHTEARKTMNILVGMYNEAEARVAAPVVPPPSDHRDHDFLLRRMAALEAEQEKNRQLLLNEDMKEPGGARAATP